MKIIILSGGPATQTYLDATPPECAGLRTRAENLAAAARQYLELNQNQTTGDDK